MDSVLLHHEHTKMIAVVPEQTPNRIKDFFGKLCDEHGFRVTHAMYSPDAFGNIQIVAECETLSIDYRLDRGDESLYFVVNGREYLVEDASRLVGDQILCGRDIDSEERWLLENVNSLKSRFQGDHRDECIKILEKSRVQRLHRMFPGSVTKA